MISLVKCDLCEVECMLMPSVIHAVLSSS